MNGTTVVGFSMYVPYVLGAIDSIDIYLEGEVVINLTPSRGVLRIIVAVAGIRDTPRNFI